MTVHLLTKAEIYDRFDAEWILIEDPELDEQLEIVRGQVVFHSKDRDEVHRKALELRPRHSAFLYTGSIPPDAAVALRGYW